ncbi:MAG: hypothetical protein RLZZ312_1108, partial [Bacteroidota bacterium]
TKSIEVLVLVSCVRRTGSIVIIHSYKIVENKIQC